LNSTTNMYSLQVRCRFHYQHADGKRNRLGCKIFMEDKEGLVPQVQQQDTWRWEGETNGRYTVRNAYRLLDRGSPNENQDGVFNIIWKLKIPIKASIFAWRLIGDRLPTKCNLRRRNIEIYDISCPFCRNHGEDASHLFFNCDNILPLGWESMS